MLPRGTPARPSTALRAVTAGPTDEAFHAPASQLLADQGNDAVLAPGSYPVDEYVWLGGRPVIVVRSKLSTTWVRQAESTGDCARNGIRRRAASTSR